jgi:ABC-type Na+ efflux pump permease subunit
VARRELGGLSREKTIVLALLIQLFVAAFSSFLVVGLTSLYDPSSVSGGVEVAATGDAADEVVQAAERRDGILVHPYADVDGARAAFAAGDVDAVLSVDRVDRRIQVTVVAPQNSFRKTLVVVQVRGTLEALERQERDRRSGHLTFQPVDLPPEVEASPYFGFTYTVLVPLLLFLPAFISGSIAVDGVTEEIERGTLELLRVAPLSLGDVLAGKGLAAAALAPAQVGLWIALLAVNGITISNPLSLLAFASALALVLVAVGLGLGVTVSDRQRAQLLYSLGILGFFSATGLLPEHPATTVARLAVGSATLGSRLWVVAYVVVAIVAVAVLARVAAHTDAEAL